MAGQWIERPAPPHVCERPEVRSAVLWGRWSTHDWQCECGKVWRWVKRFDQREGDYSGWEKVRDA